MSHYPIRPQLQNAWVCTFCGAKYRSEQERDLHIAGNCKDSPVPLMEKLQPQQTRQRPPMMKSNMFSHPEELPMPYSPTQPWDQPSPLGGYAPPPVHQETGHSGYGVYRLPEESQEGARSMRGPRPFHSTVPAQPSPLTGFGDGAASQQKNRRASDSQERQTHFGYNIPPNIGDKAKVTIIWKKEIPTLEKEVTYIDNIEDPVALAWSDERELFQGNAIFSQGNHTGSLLFPTSGEMQAVLPFEVRKKGMAMAMAALKLVMKSPIKSEPSKLLKPSSTPKPTKNESEEAKSVPPTEKGRKGMIKGMREEMDCLNKTIDTVKEDKQKVKKEMVKLEKLEKENKNLELLQHREPIDGDELLAAKEHIDQLKSHINSMEDTKLQDDRLNEKIQTLEAELKTLQAKEEKFEKLKKEQQELVNTNKDLHAELNASIRDREELEKKTNELKAEIMKKEVRMQKESGKHEKEKKSLKQEQEELIKNLKTSLEESGRQVSEKDKEIVDLVKSKMSIESDLKQARNELKENPEIKETKERVEQLSKDNSDLEEEIHTLREKNKKYKNEKMEQHEDLRGELKRFKKELEGKKNDFEEKSMELATYKDSMRDKYSKIEKEKQNLQEQVDGLHTLVNSLRVSTSDLKFRLEYPDKEKEKVKTENAKLEKELAKTEDLEKMKKDIDTNKIEQLEKELESEGENSAFLKQLIRKLNKENQTGEETVIKLKEELEQANKYKNSLEYKLEQMSQEKQTEVQKYFLTQRNT